MSYQLQYDGEAYLWTKCYHCQKSKREVDTMPHKNKQLGAL
jgi:hypothetical protein